jgi:hypothetical protein
VRYYAELGAGSGDELIRTTETALSAVNGAQQTLTAVAQVPIPAAVTITRMKKGVSMSRCSIRAGVDDVWNKTVREPDGSIRTVSSARLGRGMRWRARYVDDNGQEHTKAFTRKTAAQTWLDTEITPRLATGTYVTPHAGRVTVAEIYTSWSAVQGNVSAKTAATRRSAWGSRVQPQWGDVAVVDLKTSAVRA